MKSRFHSKAGHASVQDPRANSHPPHTTSLTMSVGQDRDNNNNQQQQVDNIDDLGAKLHRLSLSTTQEKDRGATSRGLSLSTLKELFDDITESGGLHNDAFSLRDIAFKKPEIYGTPWSTLRRKVENKVNYLKSLSPKSFQKHKAKSLIDFTDTSLYDTSKPAAEVTKKPSPLPSKPLPTTINQYTFLESIMTDYYGRVPFDFAIDRDSRPWMNRDYFIIKTESVNVGKNPIVSTAVYSICLNDIDPRWFQNDLGDWIPFKATQIGVSTIVFEKPCGPYDLLYGKKLDMSSNRQEQDEFNIARNQVRALDDRDKWRIKIKIDFGEPLDYALIDPDKRRGEMDFDFKGGLAGQGLSLVWRIAVKPQVDRVVQEQVTVNVNIRDRFALYAKAAGTYYPFACNLHALKY